MTTLIWYFPLTRDYRGTFTFIYDISSETVYYALLTFLRGHASKPGTCGALGTLSQPQGNHPHINFCVLGCSRCRRREPRKERVKRRIGVCVHTIGRAVGKK